MRLAKGLLEQLADVALQELDELGKQTAARGRWWLLADVLSSMA